MATATYIPIATQTLGSAASSITFSSIPSTYTDLRLVLVCTATYNSPSLIFNGSSASNYSQTYITGAGGAASSSYNSASNAIYITSGPTQGVSTTIPNIYTFDIFSYAGATNKTLLETLGEDHNGLGAVQVGVALWRSTSAITSITLSDATGNFSINTTATLWGI
jgi:hypothetical protein